MVPPTPFSTWEWQALWWKHFGQGKEWLALAVRHEGRVIALAPFYRDDQGNHLRLVGGEDLSDYLDILCQPGEEARVWELILDYLRSRPSGLEGLDLHCLPGHSPTLEVLPRLARDHDHAVRVELEEVCPQIELPATWQDYLLLLHRKDRHELRRKMRRTQSAPISLRFRQCSEEECAREDIKSFICLHRKSRPEKEGFMDERREAFFAEVASVFTRRGWLRLYTLEHEGGAAAAMLCFDYQGNVMLYNSGYDPAFSSLSPGIVLIANCLQDAISRRKARFDFLRGKEDYKYRLGGRDFPVYRIVVEGT